MVAQHWPQVQLESSGGRLNINMSSYQYRVSMLKIRRSRDRLIFSIEIPCLGKKVFILRRVTGLCLTTAIWRCRKPFNQWQQRKLRCHWLKFLRQRHVAVVGQGPVPLIQIILSVPKALHSLYCLDRPRRKGSAPGLLPDVPYCCASRTQNISGNLQRRCIDHDVLILHYRGRDGVSNHQHHDCLLNHSSSRWSKKTSKFRATSLCAGNSPMNGAFPAQRARNAENVSIWWRHHVTKHWIDAQLLFFHCEGASSCLP